MRFDDESFFHRAPPPLNDRSRLQQCLFAFNISIWKGLHRTLFLFEKVYMAQYAVLIIPLFPGTGPAWVMLFIWTSLID